MPWRRFGRSTRLARHLRQGQPTGRSDDDLFDIVKYGGQPFSPPHYRNRMPAYEHLLADGDMWAILAYVQSRWSADTWQRRRDLPPAS